MGDVLWWLAVVAVSETVFVFAASALVTIRLRRGFLLARLAVNGGTLAGLWIIGAGLWHRDSVDGLSVVVGCTLLAWAQHLFGAALRAHGMNRPAAAFDTEAPCQFISRGPYRRVRHPMYLASELGLAGGAALAGTWWAWAVPLWVGGLYAVAAAREESLILAGPLGPAYRRYMHQVGAIVPGWVMRRDG